MYNLISLSNISSEYGEVARIMETVRQDIGNKVRNTALSEEQLIQELADLCDDSEFRRLVSAINGATDCFYAPVSIFSNMNIFDAAYNRACEEVMFSKEAIDLTAPYLADQLATYLYAYSLVDIVYNAYEEVYGENSLLEAREVMANRLYGLDLDGEKVCDSVMKKYEKYFTRYKFNFVGKSNRTNVKLGYYNDMWLECQVIRAAKLGAGNETYVFWEENPRIYVSHDTLLFFLPY